MKKLLLTLLLSLGLTTISSAGYLDDWTDDQLCGWMDNPSPPEHIVAEVKKRGLSCGGDILAASDSSYVLNAPKAEFYQRQYDMTSKVDQILSERKTINPFLAWNYSKTKSGNYYGIAWTGGNNKRLFSNNMLEFKERYWNYFYSEKGAYKYWTDRTKQLSFVTNIDWDHDAEYGVTKAMNVTNPAYPQAFADEVHAVSEKGFNGVMLDWWHIHHPTPWRGTKQENVMISMTDEIRKQSGDDFLSNMLYYGKILYVVDAMLPEMENHYKMRYTQLEYEWAEVSEYNIWQHIVVEEWIYSKDMKLIVRYFNEGPTTVGLEDSPARIGQYLGWKIIKAFMEKNPDLTLLDLIAENNQSKILKAYKPKEIN